jgi:CBS-domain-containing membrane protein
MFKHYFRRMKGGQPHPPRVPRSEMLWSWLGSFLGISAVALISERILDGTGLVLIIGSFGASAVLIYGAVKSPLAQPRNLIGGHLISALVGVAAYQLLNPIIWLAAAVAVATAIALMHLTKTLHPPGGATALIAVIGGSQIHDLGFMYVLVPVAAGVTVMLVVALLFNNLTERRSYPVFWW